MYKHKVKLFKDIPVKLSKPSRLSKIMNIIAAFSSKNFGIGCDNAIPWHIPNDLVRFKEITLGSVVVMGRKTWDSIPESRRPLRGRLNIVVTHVPSMYKSTDQVLYVAFEELDSLLENLARTERIFIIGGSTIYKHFMGKAERIYATVVEKDVKADVFFPLNNFDRYDIESYSDMYHYEEENCNYRYITYKLRRGDVAHGEHVYLDTLRNIMNCGNMREDRTGTGTMSLFGPQLRFDISSSIPLLTTKFVPWKLTVKELLWFLQGKTDSKLLESQGVNIWKGNTTREFLDNRGLVDYREGDIGSMYGWIWRHVGAKYEGCDKSYDNQGHDQLAELIHTLKTDPFSRRHLLTTYCPLYNETGCLLPCHGIIVQFYVEQVDNKRHLSCHMYQRSSDTFLGLAINIASYSVLTYIIAKMCDMHPKELIITTGDCHLYKNHLPQAQEQLQRTPLPFPKLTVKDEVKNKTFDELTLDDFDVIGYIHHPAIKAPMSI